MKIENSYENESQEFKTSLGELDKGLLSLTAMLNKSGHGKIYYGVANDGTIIGLNHSIGPETTKKISSRIAELIKPVVLAEVLPERWEDKIYITVEAFGYNKPYSCDGEYRVRVGSENRKIDPLIMSELVLSNCAIIMESVESIDQNLTFEQLKGLYRSHHLTINEATFLSNCGLLTKRGTFNYLAEILADSNNCSIKVARFKGKDKSEMVSRNEFGYKCLLIAMQNAFDYVSSLNEVRVELRQGLERKEVSLFDNECFSEAWINACLHNKWIKNVPPAIYIFEDRIEIISMGGLPFDFSEKDFFAGVSKPVNVGLQKIMGQLDYVEQTGHGVPIIVNAYGTKAFDIEDSHITVTIPFAFEPSFKGINVASLSPSEKAVFEAIRNNPIGTIPELSQMVGLGTSRVSLIIKELKQKGKIERVGKTKGGYWKIL